MKTSSGRLFLIDGSSFCYRAFYAIRNLTTSKGQPTNAVYGVVAMLRKLIEDEKPEYLAVAFDVGKPTFRHERFEAYKQHRKPMPEPLVCQLPLIRQVLKAFRIPVFEKEGYEADDILGTISTEASQAGLDVYIVTSDKDALQLLGPRVRIYRPTKEGHEVLDEQTLLKKWQLQPSQVVDVMGLMGDEVDAIPGVPGIGEKTAVELIQKFGSVEELLKNLDKVPGEARRNAILQNKEQLQLSRELAVLDRSVPIELDLAALKKEEPDRKQLRDIFQALEFRTLVKEFAPEPSAISLEIKPLRSVEEVQAVLPAIRRAGKLAVCIAPGVARDAGQEKILIGLSWAPDSAALMEGEKPLSLLSELLLDPKLLKICPNLKETLVFFQKQGLSPQAPWTDPSLASYLLDPARPSHEMPALALEFLNESIDQPDLGQALALQAEAALRVMPVLEKEIQEKNLLNLLNEVEIPLSAVLAKMELSGIALDLDQLEALSKEMNRTLDRLTKEIHRLAGGELNINSPKQLSVVLFEQLKLPVIKRTKTGASTDEEVLRRLSTIHEMPAKILEYREVSKLRSTYVETLPQLIDPQTKKIHSSFHQTVTATGRLSSSDPNLQNIPIRTELGRQIRRAFVPSSSKSVFLAADYSQIELRILAHLSKDEKLLEAFQNGEDIHRVTAANMFHIEPASVTSDQRAAAKTINFGIVYGMTPFGLAKELGIDHVQSNAFIESYFARYPKVKQFLNGLIEEAKAQGYCTTLFSRRRYIPELKSKDPTVRQFAERVAINAPIQGSAADLIKVAMVSIDRALASQKLSSRMILQVHDELIFEVPEKELPRMKKLVKEVMEAPSFMDKQIRFSVPIEVKVSTGSNWLEASHG